MDPGPATHRPVSSHPILPGLPEWWGGGVRNDIQRAQVHWWELQQEWDHMTVIHDNPLIIIQMNIVAQSPWSVFLSVSIMKVAQPCLTLCDPIGCSWPGSSVHGILHARILEWGSLLQGVVPTQGSNPGLPHCRRVLYHLSHQGSPITGLRSPSCSLQKGCGDSGSGVVLAISLSELLDLTRNLSSCKRFVCPSHVTQPWITSLCFPCISNLLFTTVRCYCWCWEIKEEQQIESMEIHMHQYWNLVYNKDVTSGQ